MKIGIVTFYNCDNYGAELQAYALQKKLNLMGFEAELINMEKEKHSPSIRTMVTAIINRFRQYGFWGGVKSSFILIANNSPAESKKQLIILMFPGASILIIIL